MSNKVFSNLHVCSQTCFVAIIEAAISERIHECLKIGLNKCFMKGTGGDRYHISTLLGIERSVWDLLVPHTSLYYYKQDKLVIKSKDEWASHLKVDVDNVQLDGSQDFTLWFRFKGLQNISSTRSSRSSNISYEITSREILNESKMLEQL